ncbi:aLK and LTK ligand 2a [Aulostomus maculatus]
MGAMRGLRRHFSMGLVLLMCALIGRGSESAPSVAATAAARSGRDAQEHLRRMAEVVKHVEESRGQNSSRTEAPLTARARSSSAEQRDLRNVKTNTGDQVVVLYPRDLQMKEKFLKHLTGPLYFSPKCRKHMDRLYYHTRDCMIRAYFKRCARLLTRLAGSPQCTEG